MTANSRRHAAWVFTVALLATAADAKDWDVRAHGRLVYDDGTGSKPVVGAHVKAMDQDTLFDDTIAEGWTDANGNFDIRGRAGDPGLPFGICDDNCTKPDVYVTVQLANDRAVVETELGFNWHADTRVRNNAAGDLDFGAFKFASTDGGHAEILFARVVQQYDNFTRLTGGRIPKHDGKISVLFPALLAAGVPWTTDESIHWPGSESRWNAVYHEFGHRIREAADGDFAHFLYDVARFTYAQQHWYDKTTNAGFAFNEGWAEYHATLLDPSERSSLTSWAARPGGDSVEGNVAAKITHLSDKCGGFKNLWVALTAGPVHSYAEFEAAVRRKFPGCFTPPAATLRAPLALARLNGVTVAAQGVALRNIAAAVAARSELLHAQPYLKAHLRQPTRAEFAPEAAVLQRLGVVRSAAHVATVKAANASFQKHYLALQPITEESAKSGLYQQQRAVARHAFMTEALSPQLAEVEKVLAEIRTQRATPGGASLAKHLDGMKVLIEKRAQALRQVLALKPSHDLKIPLDLLPRSLAVELVAAR